MVSLKQKQWMGFIVFYMGKQIINSLYMSADKYQLITAVSIIAHKEQSNVGSTGVIIFLTILVITYENAQCL